MSKLRGVLNFPSELRPPVVAAVAGSVGQLVLSGSWWLLSLALTLGCLIYIAAWFNGYRKGGDTVMARFLDGHVEQMEKIVEQVTEEYAPDAPERVAAHQQLAELRRMQREIPR
jgi:hypothetical protein